MKNSRKVIVPIIIVLILLLMAGAAFAYVYFETDILRTDKELFLKYFDQITSGEGFVDKRIEQYYQKKSQSPYENSGEITVKVENPDNTLEDIIEKVNGLSITYSGTIDLPNKNLEENINIDYGNDVVFPITYRQINDKYGIKFEKLSKQFIAIRNEDLDENENLDEVVANITGESPISIEGKISGLTDVANQLTKGIKFTEEERIKLEEIYSPVLEQQLIEQSFSSIKTEQNSSYTLHLSSEQIRNIIIKILEATKQNPLIINKINELILEQDAEAEKIEVSKIDDLIESVNEEDIENIPNLKMTLVQNDKELNQIVIESGENKVSITKNKAEDEISYRIDSKVIEETAETSILDEKTEPVQSNFYINMKFKGLQEMNLIQENYEIGFGTIVGEESVKYDYTINSNTEFKESVEIEELDKDSALFLNDYNKEQVTSFLGQVVTRLSTINKNQMEELGLKENQNPLLYSNPVTIIIVSAMEMFDTANGVIQSGAFDLSDYEIQHYNYKFEKYVGENVDSSDVNELIRTINNNNIMNEENDLKVKVNVDGNEVDSIDRYSVSIANQYKIEAVYDDNKLVTEIKITTNN